MVGTRTHARNDNVASSRCGVRGPCPSRLTSRLATQVVAITAIRTATSAVPDAGDTPTSKATQMEMVAVGPSEEEVVEVMPLV